MTASTAPDLTGWDDLLATATVGTDRRGGTDDAPGALLDDAAVGVLRRRAGLLAVTAALPEPAPQEHLPLVPVGAAQHLAALVAEGGDLQLDLLGQWLELARQAEARVPAEQLPDLLSLGRRRRELRPALLAAGGRRISWLASQNPEWSYLGQTTEERPDALDAQAWSEGTRGRRMGYLTALRRDRPDAARELLQTDWASIGADERAALLGTFSTGLCPADEEFLEKALDDRAKEVRARAVELLGRLPGSAYAERMVARARALVVVPESGPVTVRLPTECDKAMRRDGVPAKPPAGVGERSFWLREILARTPLGSWPDDVVDRAAADEWIDDLRIGLARAAQSQEAADWAVRLYPTGPDQPAEAPGTPPGPGSGTAPGSASNSAAGTAPRASTGPAPEDAGTAHERRHRRALAELLFAVLPPERRVTATMTALRDTDDAGSWTVLLGQCPTPWPAELCAAVLAGIIRLTRHDTAYYQLEGVCRMASLQVPPAMSAVAEAELPDGIDTYRYGPLRRLAQTLRLRGDMIRQFTPSSTKESV